MATFQTMTDVHIKLILYIYHFTIHAKFFPLTPTVISILSIVWSDCPNLMSDPMFLCFLFDLTYAMPCIAVNFGTFYFIPKSQRFWKP